MKIIATSLVMHMIHNIDCIQYMNNIPDKTFDVTFYDPPYNVKKDYGVQEYE